LPIFGIISCVYLIYFLPPTSWLRFAAWLNFGFVIYVAYGIVHSRLTGRKVSDNAAEHDARSARMGALLAVIGVVLLILTRAADVYAEAIREQAGGSAFAKVFTLDPWLEVSWFLVAPLALNALVLCPIVIQRGLRAKAAGRADTGASLAIAVVYLVVSAIYLLLVATR
jgi:hypothetical protein